MSRAPLDGPDKLPRDYRKTLTVALVLLGIFGPPIAYVHAIDRRLDKHLSDMEALRPQMDDYVREERVARCSIAINVYALCLKTATECVPVEARCQTK